MQIQDHSKLIAPRTIVDAEMADMISGLACGVMHNIGFSKADLEAVLQTLEPDHAVCFVTKFCGETHAAVAVVTEDIEPEMRRLVRFPLLSHDQALDEALRLWDEIKGEYE